VGEGDEKGVRRTGVELIDTAHPLELGFGDVVERNEVEVAGEAVDGADSELMKPCEEILCHGNRLGEPLNSDVCSHLDFEIG